MSDGLDGADVGKAIGLLFGGGGVAAGLWALVKWLGGRQIAQVDEDRKRLISGIEHLTEEIRMLREANIRIASQMGSLESSLAGNKERIDEASKYWREQLEKLAERVAELERNVHSRPRRTK